MRDLADILLGLIVGVILHRQIVMAGFRLMLRDGDILVRPRDGREAE